VLAVELAERAIYRYRDRLRKNSNPAPHYPPPPPNAGGGGGASLPPVPAPPPDIALQPWLAQAKEALELIPLLQGRIVALEGLEKRVKVVEDGQAGVPFLTKQVDYLL